jgi:hypothetical protein
MKAEKFKALLDELDGNSLQTLKEKNARYSQNGDCLHNFRSGAEIVGGTPAQACWGYLTKHLVALRDMVNKDDFSNREDFLEKCQDTINYIRFLWCIGNDKSEPEYMQIVRDIDALSEPIVTGVFHLNRHEFALESEAVSVLVKMKEILKEHGEVTVSDYYELAGIPITQASYEYGWKSLDCVSVCSIAYSYDWIIKLPEPQKL